MPVRHADTAEISETIYLELVRSLFGTLIPSTVMGILFIVTAVQSIGPGSDPRLEAVALLGCAAAIVRFGVLVWLRLIAAANGLDASSARRFERIFAASYLAFAAFLGMYGGLCVWLRPVEEQLAITALIVGYGAGVAAGVSLRPWIAAPALVVSVVPAILSSLLIADSAHLHLALLLTALMVAGVASMFRQHQIAVRMIGMRLTFASLAREDPLTGAANRLGLQEAFAQAVERSGSKSTVLHCIDLDRFKAINDTHGHIVGDSLLQAVAGRLDRLVRSGDLTVRLGGDEFAILQTQVHHPSEAELLARRIVRAIAEPYLIDGHRLEVGASLGWASSAEHGNDLDRLLAIADESLYSMKNGGLGRLAIAS